MQKKCIEQSGRGSKVAEPGRIYLRRSTKRPKTWGI